MSTQLQPMCYMVYVSSLFFIRLSWMVDLAAVIFLSFGSCSFVQFKGTKKNKKKTEAKFYRLFS